MDNSTVRSELRSPKPRRMAALKAAEIAASTDPDWRQVRVLMVSVASSTMSKELQQATAPA
jgi:hypothetical protein